MKESGALPGTTGSFLRKASYAHIQKHLMLLHPHSNELVLRRYINSNVDFAGEGRWSTLTMTPDRI